MTAQTATRGALAAPTSLRRPTVVLTALGCLVLDLIHQQDALPESDTAGRAQIDREIDALLGLED